MQYAATDNNDNNGGIKSSSTYGGTLTHFFGPKFPND